MLTTNPPAASALSAATRVAGLPHPLTNVIPDRASNSPAAPANSYAGEPGSALPRTHTCAALSPRPTTVRLLIRFPSTKTRIFDTARREIANSLTICPLHLVPRRGSLRARLAAEEGAARELSIRKLGLQTFAIALSDAGGKHRDFLLVRSHHLHCFAAEDQ